MPGFLDLWIFISLYSCIDRSLYLYIRIPRSCRSADPHIFIAEIFRSHSQIQHSYIILSSYYFSTIIISFHTFLVLQVSYYNSFLLFFQYQTFLLHHTSKLILPYLNDTHLLTLCYHSNTFDYLCCHFTILSWYSFQLPLLLLYS